MGWTNSAASDGTMYEVCLQDQANSCVCACIATVARLVLNKRLDESTVRRWVGEAEGSKNISSDKIRHFENKAASIDVVGEVLKKLKLSALRVHGSDNVKKWLPSASPSRPALVGLKWTRLDPVTNNYEYHGGGHMVVCVGVRGNNAVFLDPGVGVVDIPADVPPRYGVTYPGSAQRSTGVLQEMQQL